MKFFSPKPLLSVAAVLKPEWVCKDQQEFTWTFQRLFNQPLQLATLPSGADMNQLSCITALQSP